MKHSILLVCLVCLCLALNGLSAEPTRAQSDDEARIEALLSGMSVEARVGQLFIVGVYGTIINSTTESFLREIQPGGIAYFDSNGKDLCTAINTTELWQSFAARNGAGIPVLIGTDHEGGTVQRLTEGFSALPYGMALGAMPPDLVYKVGEKAAQELRAVGIHMNFAPVADVRLDPKITFMDRRVLSDDPLRAAAATAAYVRGLQGTNGSGVIATLKHFPGHGAAGDSHVFLPTVTTSRAEWDATERLTFEAGIAAGAEAVMVGHLIFPALEPAPNLPTSLSRTVVTGLLRDTLGFKGLIISDAMEMAAIVDNFSVAEAAITAINAGVDMLTASSRMPMSDQRAMYQAVLAAVRDGRISQARIDDSVRRILRLKLKYGLLDAPILNTDCSQTARRAQAYPELPEYFYRSAVAKIFDNFNLLPIQPKSQKIGLIYPGAWLTIRDRCGVHGGVIRNLGFSLNPTNEEIIIARQIARAADVVIIFTFNLKDHPRQADLVNTVPSTKSIVVAMGSPYDAQQGIEPGAYLAGFNPVLPMVNAACEIIYGKIQPIGVFTLKE